MECVDGYIITRVQGGEHSCADTDALVCGRRVRCSSFAESSEHSRTG